MSEYRQYRFRAPEGATQILLVRHGESRPARADEPFPLVDGQGDPELHAEGRVQAAQVAHRLRDEPIAAVYVTSLRRTRETAAPLCAHLGIEPRVEADLREVHLGDWEGGLMRVKAAEGDPLYKRVIGEERWDVIPGAESADAVEARVRPALEKINARHPNQLVVAVVHGGVIGHIVARATGASPFSFIRADNGSISPIVLHDSKVIVRGFNDIAHLGRSFQANAS